MIKKREMKAFISGIPILSLSRTQMSKGCYVIKNDYKAILLERHPNQSILHLVCFHVSIRNVKGG